MKTNPVSAIPGLMLELLPLAKQAGDAIMTVYRSGDFGATAKADAANQTLYSTKPLAIKPNIGRFRLAGN